MVVEGRKGIFFFWGGALIIFPDHPILRGLGGVFSVLIRWLVLSHFVLCVDKEFHNELLTPLAPLYVCGHFWRGILQPKI